ncbi:MAG: aldehyde dehydrogenase family protein, partial [Alphaproteobacteria bacterium]
MYINGEWREAANGGRFDVLNPANGDVVGNVPDGGAADVADAIAAASDAAAGWAGR